MKVIAVIGMKETGKTTRIKEILSKIPLRVERYIFDPNRHYPQCIAGETFENFVKRVYSVSNSVIVVEEATMLLKSKKRNELMEALMIRCRHQRNLIIFAFHSFRSLPTWIVDEIDAMYILKTMDTDMSMRKVKGILGVYETFEKVQNSENIHECEFLDFKPQLVAQWKSK